MFPSEILLGIPEGTLRGIGIPSGITSKNLLKIPPRIPKGMYLSIPSSIELKLDWPLVDVTPVSPDQLH